MAACSKCGAELKPDDNFCTQCGTGVALESLKPVPSGPVPSGVHTTDEKIKADEPAVKTVIIRCLIPFIIGGIAGYFTGNFVNVGFSSSGILAVISIDTFTAISTGLIVYGAGTLLWYKGLDGTFLRYIALLAVNLSLFFTGAWCLGWLIGAIGFAIGGSTGGYIGAYLGFIIGGNGMNILYKSPLFRYIILGLLHDG